MTLHKAKGLEFDVVFHWTSTNGSFRCIKGDEIQDLNLHYVGITRAKQCCVLCTSTRRHNDQGERSAEDSPFLQMNNLTGATDSMPDMTEVTAPMTALPSDLRKTLENAVIAARRAAEEAARAALTALAVAGAQTLRAG